MPTRLRLLNGNRSKRPINADEPEPEALQTLDAPSMIQDVALVEWRNVTARLAELGMLAKIDTNLLVLYCTTWAAWVNAKEKLAQFGEVVKAPKTNYPIQSPYVSIEKSLGIRVHRLLAELGMTPSSRTRVKVPGGKKTKLEKFLTSTARHRQRA